MCAAFSDFGLRGFLDAYFFFLVLIEKQDWRLARVAPALFFFFRFKNVAFIGKLDGALCFGRCSAASELVHRFAAGDARFLHTAAIAFLLAAVAPVVPARLGLLQQTQ